MDTNTKAKGKTPTHTIYAVTKRGTFEKFTPIGSAWAHEDGQGMNQVFDFFPVNGAKIVIRPRKAKEEVTEQGEVVATA